MKREGDRRKCEGRKKEKDSLIPHLHRSSC